MKKFKIFILLIVVTMQLTGCGLGKEYKSSEQIGVERATFVYEAFINENLEGIKSMFSSFVAESIDLEQNIEDAFDFIEGDIVSHGKIFTSTALKTSIKEDSSEILFDVETTSEKNYEITINTCVYDQENKEYIGTYMIYIVDTATNDNFKLGKTINSILKNE